MNNQTGFRATARSVRSEARAKLRELRLDRIARRQELASQLSTGPAVVAEEEFPGALYDSAGKPPPLPCEENSGGEISHLDVAGHLADLPETDCDLPIDATSNIGTGPEKSALPPAIDDIPLWDFGADKVPDAAETRALAEIDSLDSSPFSLPMPDILMCDNSHELEETKSSGGMVDECNDGPGDQEPSEPCPQFITNRTKRVDTADMQEHERAVAPEPDCPEPAPALASSPVASSLASLPGAGPGLVWMLNGCGIQNLADLAVVDRAKLTRDLGLVGQILDVGPWIEFAKANADTSVSPD